VIELGSRWSIGNEQQVLIWKVKGSSQCEEFSLEVKTLSLLRSRDWNFSLMLFVKLASSLMKSLTVVPSIITTPIL